MNRFFKDVLFPRLPTSFHRRYRRRKQLSESHDHRDPAFVTVTPELVLETYWKDVEAGRGPALVVWFDYRKIMKFDCFGKGRGHYHVSHAVHSAHTEKHSRIYLPEETIEAQIERVVFELKTNLPYYLARAPYSGAREAVISEVELLRGIEEARVLLVQHRLSSLSSDGAASGRTGRSGR